MSDALLFCFYPFDRHIWRAERGNEYYSVYMWILMIEVNDMDDYDMRIAKLTADELSELSRLEKEFNQKHDKKFVLVAYTDTVE